MVPPAWENADDGDTYHILDTTGGNDHPNLQSSNSARGDPSALPVLVIAAHFAKIDLHNRSTRQVS